MTISDYTIYCTPEQTCNALELGATIEVLYDKVDYQQKIPTISIKKEYVTYDYYIPTAEQMIGWLKTKGCTPYVYPVRREGRSVLSARLLIKLDAGDSDSFHGFGEDYDIILSAIDAALKYLGNQKK